ncbi:hypothetical protein [Marinicella meishanensis]|uniref:hypothetical protein n=1 Tax=Marinicella meishanensis TaxID=2873263 RepID=UPI001CBF9CA6|nr:hypothetical protein [Marinicella sp. NBU2979]
MDDFAIEVMEVEDAEPLAGALFQRAFGDSIPNFPRHFILSASGSDARHSTLGYVHFTRHQDMYLGGGMCVDPQALRRLPKTCRQQLNEQGGVAFCLLSQAVKRLDDAPAVFGHVGHQGAYKIDLAVGFEPTQFPHLIVYWQQPLSQAAQQDIIQRAHEVGPF